MAIDLSTETVFPLIDAPARSLFTRGNGKKPHKATLFRWAKNGCRGVRLETIRIGGTICTSTEAIYRGVLSIVDGPAKRSRMNAAGAA